MPSKFHCDECNRDLVSNYTLQRHYKEVHGRGAITYKCEHCDHRSKRPSDLQKHTDAKHPSGAAKPKGPKRRKRIAPVYRTKQGEKLMSDAIKAALKPSKKS